MACSCVADINQDLRANHNGVLVTTLFGQQKAVIGVEKVDSKKRGKPPIFIASYCPFCGVPYEAKTPKENDHG